MTKEQLRELRIGCYVFAKDVRPMFPHSQKRTYYWEVRWLDEYWLRSVLCFGNDWVEPIPLTEQLLDAFPDLCKSDDGTYEIVGTPFHLATLYDGSWSVETQDLTGISRVCYLHQLQNVYYDITGAEMSCHMVNKYAEYDGKKDKGK